MNKNLYTYKQKLNGFKFFKSLLTYKEVAMR
jgi:hypothetical protein